MDSLSVWQLAHGIGGNKGDPAVNVTAQFASALRYLRWVPVFPHAVQGKRDSKLVTAACPFISRYFCQDSSVAGKAP